MKRLLSTLLIFTMLISLSISASAASITTNGGAGSTVVTYGMSESFTVVIPGDFTIDDSNKAVAEVSASNVMISHGSILNVAVSGHDYADKWELIDMAEATNKLAYNIGTTEDGSDIVNNSVILDVAAGEAPSSTVTEKMYFTVTDTLTKAGTYTDTLTFTVSVVGLAFIGELTELIDISTSTLYAKISVGGAEKELNIISVYDKSISEYKYLSDYNFVKISKILTALQELEGSKIEVVPFDGGYRLLTQFDW